MNLAMSSSDLQSALRASRPPIVIDVRKEPAFKAATEMIAGALRRDPAAVAGWAKEVPSAGTVVVYCVHGH